MPGPGNCRSDTVTPPSRVVVVGASIGGITAAETLRREGFDGEIVVVGDEPHRPYLRPPLSKQILLGEWEPEQAFIQTVAQTDELDIDLRTSCVALDLDVAGRVVQTSQGDLPYDELIIATGSEPRRHPRLPSALTLRTMDDALNLRDGLQSAHRVGVIGVGVLGSEIASAARKYGAETLLIGRSASLTFGGVGALLSSRLIRLHEDNGVGLLRLVFRHCCLDVDLGPLSARDVLCHVRETDACRECAQEREAGAVIAIREPPSEEAIVRLLAMAQSGDPHERWWCAGRALALQRRRQCAPRRLGSRGEECGELLGNAEDTALT